MVACFEWGQAIVGQPILAAAGFQPAFCPGAKTRASPEKAAWKGVPRGDPRAGLPAPHSVYLTGGFGAGAGGGTGAGGAAGAFAATISSSSISNVSVAPPGIVGGCPTLP